MRQFFLTEITTKDRLVHQGIFFRPVRNSPLAILWIHGLTSTFYAGLPVLDILIDYCEGRDIGFAAFNNRGHDFLTGGRKVDRRKAKGYDYAVVGSGVEDFTKCIFDIDAGITYLAEQGFSRIILIGSSTGANKVTFYAGKTQDTRLAGVALLSPISDRLVPGTDSTRRREEIQLMKGLVKRGKGDELLLGHHYFPITPKRFLSLYVPGNEEDTFDYGDAKPRMKYFYKIKKPLLVLFGSEDEARDRPIEKIRNVFDAHTGSPAYTSVVIKGATHNYTGKERELVHTVFKWIATL